MGEKKNIFLESVTDNLGHLLGEDEEVGIKRRWRPYTSVYSPKSYTNGDGVAPELKYPSAIKEK